MPENQCFVGSPRVAKGWCSVLALAAALALTGCSDRNERAFAEAQRAEALMQQGNLPEARMAIASALRLRDDQVDYLLLDARIKFMMQDIRGAYEGYRVVLAMNPNNPEALLGVAQLGMSTGNERESRDAADRILAMEPSQPDALLIKGVHALNRKRHEEALELGERLLAGAPGDTRGIVLKARAISLLGRPDEALELLLDAATGSGNNDMLATAMLEVARDKSNVQVMLEQLALLRGSRPNSIDLAIDEANIRYKSGDRERARTVGREILDRHGDNAEALSRLADLWLEYDGDPLTAAERASLAAGGKRGARLALAKYYFDRGDLAAAEPLVASLGGDRAGGLKARIALALGRPGAAAAVEDIAARDTSNCDALAALAEIRLGRGDARGAVIAAQTLAAECEDRNDGFLLLARAYDAQGRTAGVERAYREGVSVRPLDRILSARLAEWLLSQGREQAAVSAARRLAQSVPAKVSSWRLLAEICLQADDAVCAGSAREREEEARTNYVIDLPPGQRAANPLLGQRWQ